MNKNSERKTKLFNKTHLFIQIFVFLKRENFNCWFEINLINFKNRKNRYKCTKILVNVSIVKPEACFKDPLSQFMHNNLNNYLNDYNRWENKKLKCKKRVKFIIDRSHLFRQENVMQYAMLFMRSLPSTKLPFQFVQIATTNHIRPFAIVTAIRFSWHWRRCLLLVKI